MLRIKFNSLVLVLLVITVNATAQHAITIKENAEELVTATVNNDFKVVVKYTYPALVKMMGGADKMISVLTKGFETMKAQGAAFKGGEIGEPGKILNTGDKLFSVVPEKLIMESNGTKFYITSSLLAISLNKGVNWYFLDGGNMTDTQIQQLFPEVRGKLTIAKRTNPVVIND